MRSVLFILAIFGTLGAYMVHPACDYTTGCECSRLGIQRQYCG
jgi:hypothetical protein